MADQLRVDVLGKGFTPTIDALRQEGVAFDRSYCACPLCVPSRGAFFSGMHPNSNGSLINPWEPEDAHYGDMKSSIDTLYTLMENAWDSLHSGKQHVYTEGGNLENRKDSPTTWLATEATYKQYLHNVGKRAPGGPSFKTKVPEMVDGKVTKISSYSNAEVGVYEEGEAYYFDSYYADKAVEGLRSRDKDKPVLLNAMFVAPHPPFQIPEPWFSKVAADAFELPQNVGLYSPRQSPLQMYNLTGIVGARYGREHWHEAWRVYLGLVSLLDNCIKRIIDELKAQGIYDESLIIFTSDHGEMLGSHSLYQKMCMYEESVRVPLYMKFPKEEGVPRFVSSALVSNIDVFPTLCKYLHLSPFQKVEGQSLLPIILGTGTSQQARPIFIQYDGNGSRSNFQRCVVQGQFKLIVDMFKDEVYYELYDVLSDPQEQENLLFTVGHDKIIESLFAMLDQHMKETGDLIRLQPFNADEFRKAYVAFPTK